MSARRPSGASSRVCEAIYCVSRGSPLVADLYRRWYVEEGIRTDRLLVESFAFMEPYQALLTRSVPFWMTFNMEPSLRRVEAYLDGAEPYEEIRLMLFSHGTEAVGLPSIRRWMEVPGRARRRGSLLGVDGRKFPLDFAAQVRYATEARKIAPRYPAPDPMTPAWLDVALGEVAGRYPVRWQEAT